MKIDQNVKINQVLNLTVVVAALGYFVDVYDLVLFLIIGKKSLLDLIPGIGKEELDEQFQYLLNVQMIGMLLGGIFWGVLGDKKGRLSVLFGSILMYSLANIANGLIAHVDTDQESLIKIYAALRLVAGIGLAGELGAGITLVSEIMSKETRGFGTMIVASVGVTGAVAAGLIGRTIGWEVTYYIGGCLGIALLLLRIGVFESGIFKNIMERPVNRGNFLMLFSNWRRTLKYLNCILIGLPVWYFIGILVGRAPRIAEVLEINGVEQEFSVMICYTGLIFGDIVSGSLSQILKSRKKVFYGFFILCCVVVATYVNLRGVSPAVFYSAIFMLGFSVGFWAVLVTVGSEQFGTNVRATAATTIPNFIRGSLVPISFLFEAVLNYFKPGYSEPLDALRPTIAVVTGIVMLISFTSLYFLDETFGKDLDFLEEDRIP
jgi:MFS family permease